MTYTRLIYLMESARKTIFSPYLFRQFFSFAFFSLRFIQSTTLNSRYHIQFANKQTDEQTNERKKSFANKMGKTKMEWQIMGCVCNCCHQDAWIFEVKHEMENHQQLNAVKWDDATGVTNIHTCTQQFRTVHFCPCANIVCVREHKYSLQLTDANVHRF